MADPWAPPVDASGGYFILGYLNGAFLHMGRFHVAAFDKFSLTYSVAHGAETDVSDTIDAVIGLMKAFYTSAWEVGFHALWNNTGGVLAPVPIPPVITPHAGTNGGSEAERADLEQTFTIPTSGGRKAKIITIAAAGLTESTPAVYNSSSGGVIGALMAYLVGGSTGVVAHDGTALLDYAHATISQNRRLTRRYHFN